MTCHKRVTYIHIYICIYVYVYIYIYIYIYMVPKKFNFINFINIFRIVY